MPKTRKQKEEAVVKLADKVRSSKSLVFADYKGMTMTQLSQLRDALREQGAEFSVTKNNLLKIALKNEQRATSNEQIFEGPIATLFAYEDEITPIKTLVKALKDNQIGSLKGGFLAQDYLSDSQISQLANLPSKVELQAKVVGTIAGPLYGIVNVLQANIRNLVYALDQIRVQKGVSNEN